MTPIPFGAPVGIVFRRLEGDDDRRQVLPLLLALADEAHDAACVWARVVRLDLHRGRRPGGSGLDLHRGTQNGQVVRARRRLARTARGNHSIPELGDGGPTLPGRGEPGAGVGGRPRLDRAPRRSPTSGGGTDADEPHALRWECSHSSSPELRASRPPVTRGRCPRSCCPPFCGNCPRALTAYRRRLAELDAELDQARAWSDPARADRLAEGRQALLAEIARATGMGGRPRRSGAAWERARVAVRKVIATAVGRIEEVDPAVARLLRDTVSTGGTCRYEPDPARPVRWVLDD